ncbi:MAG: hypothetical protein ACMXYG_07135 [Candidatus Woesearchaeota archaeon]
MKKIIKTKKGASISLEVVVIAAVALLVLVVLTVVFADRLGIFGDGLRYCDTLCTQSSQECNAQGYELSAYYGKCEDIQGNKITERAYCCKVRTE